MAGTMIVKDNIFDKFYMDELAFDLKFKVKWRADNSASRSYPYNSNQNYLLMGSTFFKRETMDIIKYGDDMDLNRKLIDSFYHIKNEFKKPDLVLKEISGNCQFQHMDGKLHTDGSQVGLTSYILMLSPDYDVQDIGGVFYSETDQKEVPFKHGRVIEIDSFNVHRGEAFNKQHKLRFSIKFTGFIN